MSQVFVESPQLPVKFEIHTYISPGFPKLRLCEHRTRHDGPQGRSKEEEASEAAASTSEQVFCTHLRPYHMDSCVYYPTPLDLAANLPVMVDIFFREIRSRGSYRIPRRGPVIFVAAPHANQVSSSAGKAEN
jgi:hypothetical protein